MQISNLEVAKKYFMEMGCSHFHMHRENPNLYEAYTNFNISKDVETAWTEESLRQMQAKILSTTIIRNGLWRDYARMEDLVVSLKTIESLKVIYETTKKIEKQLLSQGKMLVAETINGRQDLEYRSGLIFLAYDLGMKEVAKDLCNISLRLSHSAKSKLKSESERCKEAHSKTIKICKALGIEV